MVGACRISSIMYNGTLPNVVSVKQVGGETIVGVHFIEYKCYRAQRTGLALGLNITPIGTSGVIITSATDANCAAAAV